MPPRKIIQQKYVEIISRYLAENPELSNNDIARLILKNEKIESSATMEAFKRIVARVRGEVKVDTFTLEEDGLELPESDYTEYKPFIIPSGRNKLLILNDIHLPYHSRQALKTAIDEGVRQGCDTVILNGDTIDFYGVSRFVKDPSVRDVIGELSVAKQFLEYLRSKFPEAQIVYKTGNHEDRWKHWIFHNLETVSHTLKIDPKQIAEFRLDNRLELCKHRIDFVDDKQLIKSGRLFIAHGHEIFSASGAINVARNFRLKANDNVLFGHFHRTQDDYAKSLSEKIMGAWAVGCLCGLSPLYMPINQWNHGFAIVDMDKDGMFDVQNKKVIGGIVR